jgi:hypothetical protein
VIDLLPFFWTYGEIVLSSELLLPRLRATDDTLGAGVYIHVLRACLDSHKKRACLDSCTKMMAKNYTILTYSVCSKVLMRLALH